MKEIRFRAWHHKENKMYYRGYQKWLSILLCEDDHGSNEGNGRPIKKAPYSEVTMLESTGLFDKAQREIFEGDIIRVRYKDTDFVDVVGTVPDTFGAGKIHPLKPMLAKHGIHGYPQNLEIEILGNQYENPTLVELSKK